MFNILDVAGIFHVNILGRSGAEVYAVCPFCGDKRKKFSMAVKKGNRSNVYRCFHCGKQGDQFDLYRELSGKNYDYESAPKQIARDIYHDLGENNTCRSFMEPVVYEECMKLPDAELSESYVEIFKCLTLKPEHKADLKRRGFSEDEIRMYGFKSVPDSNSAERIIAGISAKKEGVPGLFEMNGKFTMKTNRGYFCPVYHGKYLVGAQISTDAHRAFDKAPDRFESEPAKYIHFSSSGLKKGTPSGSPATILIGHNPNVVVITEGILKATAAYSLCGHSFTVIGVPGVLAISGIKDVISMIPKNAVVFEAYDMDSKLPLPDTHEMIEAFYPNLVKKGLSDSLIIAKEKKKREDLTEAALKLRRLLASYELTVQPLTWDLDDNGDWKGNYKGIDDALLVTGGDRFIPYLMKRASGVSKINNA